MERDPVASPYELVNREGAGAVAELSLASREDGAIAGLLAGHELRPREPRDNRLDSGYPAGKEGNGEPARVISNYRRAPYSLFLQAVGDYFRGSLEIMQGDFAAVLSVENNGIGLNLKKFIDEHSVLSHPAVEKFWLKIGQPIIP